MSNIIILDIDDTSGDLKTRLQDLYRKETGDESIHYDQWDEYFVSHRYGISEERLYEMFIESATMESMDPHDGLSEITNEIHRRGYQIEIVTARGWHPKGYDVTKEWLDRNKVAYDNINVVPLDQCKEVATRRLGDIKLFVDDRDDHCFNMMRSGRVEQCLLYSQPWNASFELFPHIDKIDNLYDILNYI